MPDDLTATPTQLYWLTIADAARLIERRQLSPVELTDALLARIEALDPQLKLFCCRRRKRRASRPAQRNAKSWPGAIAARCTACRSG